MDGIGDNCDDCIDVDWDGYGDPGYAHACPEDNCPLLFNPLQKDTYPPQGNSIGDACECEGDFDCDGDVDKYDLEIFLVNYNRRALDKTESATDDSVGDFDCDLDVDDRDRVIFLEDFGRNPRNNPCPACKEGEWCSN